MPRATRFEKLWRLVRCKEKEREREKEGRGKKVEKSKLGRETVRTDRKLALAVELKFFSLSRRRDEALGYAARCSAVKGEVGSRRPCSGLRRNSSTPRHQQVTRRGVAKSSVAARRVRAIKALRDRESYERVVASTRKLSPSLSLSLCSIKTIQRPSFPPFLPVLCPFRRFRGGEKMARDAISHGWTIGLLADVNWPGLIAVRKQAG